MLAEDQAADVLSSVSTLLRTVRTMAGRMHGESFAGTQVGVLKLVREQESRLGDLAERLQIAPSVASRVVASLETDGLVQRHPDPADARACLIGLTDLGRQRLVERERFARTQIREALADWSEQDADDAVRILHRLEERFGDYARRMAEHPVLTTQAVDPAGGSATARTRAASPNHILEMENTAV